MLLILSKKLLSTTKVQNKCKTLRRVRRSYYLLVNHDFFAKNITRLISQIGSHCTPKSSPIQYTRKENATH